jgi:hypothetical protein
MFLTAFLGFDFGKKTGVAIKAYGIVAVTS